jgi:hypothetical protein
MLNEELQDSNWTGIISIILIEKIYLEIMLSKNLYVWDNHIWILKHFPLKTLSIVSLYFEIRTSLFSTLEQSGSINGTKNMENQTIYCEFYFSDGFF